MTLYRSEMTAYARLQLAAAQQTLNDHHPDETGCCACCGRPGPCPARVAAQTAHDWYEAWLHPPAFATTHRFIAAGRPYVRNAGPAL